MFYSQEEEAKRLGFNSVDELLLCRDICGFETIPIADRRLLLEQCEDDRIGRSKEDFIEYMEENDLIDLYNRIKYLSPLERYIELYNYYYNMLELSNSVLGIYNRKLKEAQELFDGEKEEDYTKKRKKLYTQMERYIQRKRELENISIIRLNEKDEEKFIAYIETLEEHRQEMKNLGRKL